MPRKTIVPRLLSTRRCGCHTLSLKRFLFLLLVHLKHLPSFTQMGVCVRAYFRDCMSLMNQRERTRVQYALNRCQIRKSNSQQQFMIIIEEIVLGLQYKLCRYILMLFGKSRQNERMPYGVRTTIHRGKNVNSRLNYI